MSYITHMVTPVPLVKSPVVRFFDSFAVYNIINTVFALGSLALTFYLFYSFSKYGKHGKHGRDVSKETQEHDKQSLVDHGLIDPEPSDHHFENNSKDSAYHRPTTKEPAAKPQSNVTKPVTKAPSVRRSVKKDDINRVGE